MFCRVPELEDPLGRDFPLAFAQFVRGETDPRNLNIVLPLARRVATHFEKELQGSSSSEVLFPSSPPLTPPTQAIFQII